MAKSKMSDVMVKTKFLLFNIKKIVRDRRGRFVYTDAFDQVIEDVYGVKHLVRDINDCYDNRDVIDCLDACGIETMVKMFSNPRLKAILVELVEAKFMMDELRKDIRKRTKKGRNRNKNDIKKYKFLSERYKRGSKYLRKRLGIKTNKDAYKNQFRALNELDNDFYTGGHGFLSGGDDDFFDDWGGDDYVVDYDDEDEDDYYSRSELDDFVMQMTGKDPREDLRRIQRDIRRKQGRNSSRYSDIDLGFDDDDDDDYSDVERELTEDVDEKIDKLTDSVAILADSVNAMMSKNEFDRNVSRRQRAVRDEDLDELGAFEAKSDEDSIQMKKLMNALANRVQDLSESYGDLVDSQNDIIDTLNEMIDDGEDGNMSDEVVVTQNTDENLNIPNNNFSKSSSSPTDVRDLTREELIDAINHSQPPFGGSDKTESSTEVVGNQTADSSK